MKTNIFKRSIAGLMAFAVLLATMVSFDGTTVYAAGNVSSAIEGTWSTMWCSP